MTDNINFPQTLDFLRKILPEAGEILKKHFEKGDYFLKTKEGVDFTTQADIETDEFLRKQIAKKYPTHQFLTEETAKNEDFSKFRDVENLWIIDPLDGTANFATHDSHFAISVAFARFGEVLLGVTYAPIWSETYRAIKGHGAFFGKKRIHVSENDDLKKAMLRGDWSWDLKKRKRMAKAIEKVCDKVRFILLKGAGVLDLSRLARGDFDGYLHPGLKPWDVAAASLIIKEAGGVITSFDGGKWDIFEPSVFAANPKIHPKILEIIKGI